MNPKYSLGLAGRATEPLEPINEVKRNNFSRAGAGFQDGRIIPSQVPTYNSDGGMLIEPQRTNLVIHSNNFTNVSWSVVAGGTGVLPVITPNAGISPDGTNNASRLVLGLNGGTSDSDRSGIQGAIVTVGSGATTAKTIWIKSNDSNSYDLNLIEGTVGGNPGQLVTALPNVWTRVENVGSVTGTQSRFALSLDNRFGVTVSDTADILIYGAQLEEGAFSTSYIPTESSSMTRVASSFNTDDLTLTNALSPTTGSVFLDFDFEPMEDVNQTGIRISNDATDKGVYFYTSTTPGKLVFQLRDGSNTNLQFPSEKGTRHKILLIWDDLISVLYYYNKIVYVGSAMDSVNKVNYGSTRQSTIYDIQTYSSPINNVGSVERLFKSDSYEDLIKDLNYKRK